MGKRLGQEKDVSVCAGLVQSVYECPNVAAFLR